MRGNGLDRAMDYGIDSAIELEAGTVPTGEDTS